MLRYTVIRILLLIPILLCVTFIVYALMDLAPGNIVDTMISEEMTQEDIDLLYKKFDLDKPMIVRYFKYLNGLLHGDIGDSQVTGMSVFHLFISRFPNTFRMAILGIVFATIIAIPIGLFNAKHAGTIADNITTAIALVFMSMPSFWLGLMLLIFFANKLKIFPAAYDGTWKCYVLPVVASGVSMSASTIRQTRSAVLEVSRQDFLRTARAKGVSERKVMWKHELGNALIPIITQIGMMIAISLAGSAVIEAVYSWPGVGYMMVEAITRRDSTLACGCVVLTSTMFSVVLLLVDLVYAMVDPRIRAAYSSHKKKKKAVKA